MYEKWQDERWEAQRQINEKLFLLLADSSRSISSLKERITWAAGFMGAVIVLAPVLWKFVMVVMGIKP